MNDAEAYEISGWRYPPPYDFYDPAGDEEDLAELLDPGKRRDHHYYSAFSDDDLVGFLCFGAGARVPGLPYEDDGSLDIGLGLSPDLTGRGLGLAFLGAGLGFARARFAPDRFRLSVATFNERAIKVYERAGFRPVGTFVQHAEGGRHPFLLMTREAQGACC